MGIAAWPVNNFVLENDFTGKTVIPFCTSASSSLGDSGKLLKKMAGIVTHIAFYVGWPKGWAAFNIAKEIYKDC